MPLETRNTERALETLRAYTGKRILIRPLEEFSHPSFSPSASYLGIVDETQGEIIIYLSGQCPEQTLVHEVLHKVLDYEGFPNAWIEPGLAGRLPAEMLRVLPNLQSTLTSTAQHPEVFRRMEEEYDLELDSYHGIQAGQKLRRLERLRDKQDPWLYHFMRQEDILMGLDYFLWGAHGERVLELFREAFPEACESCVRLHEKVVKTGFSTPGEALASALVIKDHLIGYGEAHGIEGVLNDMWRALDIR
jgi:hypothetical protein